MCVAIIVTLYLYRREFVMSLQQSDYDGWSLLFGLANLKYYYAYVWRKVYKILVKKIV